MSLFDLSLSLCVCVRLFVGVAPAGWELRGCRQTSCSFLFGSRLWWCRRRVFVVPCLRCFRSHLRFVVAPLVAANLIFLVRPVSGPASKRRLYRSCCTCEGAISLALALPHTHTCLCIHTYPIRTPAVDNHGQRSTVNPDGTTPNATCPPYGPEFGITDSHPRSVFETYKSFELTTPVLTLQPPPGSSSCYPFRDVIGTLGFVESEAPQCIRPRKTDTMVCAFKYEESSEPTNFPSASPSMMTMIGDANATNATNSSMTNVTESPELQCAGRRYAMLEYETAEEAVADGAYVTHTGNCGVCSNAFDLGIRMEKKETFQASITLCGISFFLAGSRNPNRFNNLIDCLGESGDVGYSRPCATLWAYYSATNAYNCSAPCAAGFGGDVPLNKDLPGCPFSDCLACAEDVFQADMNLQSGRSDPNSGMLEQSARACDEFSFVTHDPCPGVTFTASPTQAPSAPTSGTGTMMRSTVVATAIAAMVSAVWMVMG